MMMGSITDHPAPFRSTYGQAKMAALQLLPVRIDGCREGQMAVAVGRLSFQGCPSLWGVELRRLLRPEGRAPTCGRFPRSGFAALRSHRIATEHEPSGTVLNHLG